MALRSENMLTMREETRLEAPGSIEILPLEIVTIIFQNLVEYDLSQGDNSEHTEESGYRRIRLYHDEEIPMNCIELTGNAHLAILNARLSSRNLYHASQNSFAKLLADRVFRFTRVDTEDLRQTGRKKELVPYITTITIGCAGFRNVEELDKMIKITKLVS